MDKADVRKGNADLLDLSPLRSIRAKCLDCCCGSSNEVKACPCDGVNGELCPLYQYRLGHNPNRTPRQYTDEERQAIAERLSQYRKNGLGLNATEGKSDAFDESDETMPPEETDDNSLDICGESEIHGENNL